MFRRFRKRLRGLAMTVTSPRNCVRVNVLLASLPALSAGLLIDRVLGDPHWLWKRVPHPVALAGRAIDWLDARLNDPQLSFARRRRRGTLALVGLVLVGGVLGYALHAAFRVVPLGMAARSGRDRDPARAKEPARARLGRGDDAGSTKGLTAGQRVGRADRRARRFVSSTRPASRAPRSSPRRRIFPTAWWLLPSGMSLLGLPGLFVFKVVNTANSMIGHRSPRHEAFGWAAARLDDLLNLVPARLSAAAHRSAGGARRARRAARRSERRSRDARMHKSPNAGWPEAAIAGALGLALGGPRRYGDVEVDGAWLNPAGRREADAGRYPRRPPADRCGVGALLVASRAARSPPSRFAR